MNQNERAVKTIFGRAQRVSNLTTLDDPVSDALNPDEKTRYAYPQVRVIMPADRFFSAADALLVPKKRKPQLACPKAAIAGKFPHEYRSHQS